MEVAVKLIKKFHFLGLLAKILFLRNWNFFRGSLIKVFVSIENSQLSIIDVWKKFQLQEGWTVWILKHFYQILSTFSVALKKS